jgi:hypothetical protein
MGSTAGNQGRVGDRVVLKHTVSYGTVYAPPISLQSLQGKLRGSRVVVLTVSVPDYPSRTIGRLAV